MDELTPCRGCGETPGVVMRWVIGQDMYRVTHECKTPLVATEEVARGQWNAANAPADPALLALAKMGASLLDRAWVEQVGFFDDSTLQDDLDRAAVAFGLVRYESPCNFQMAPGIASAIAALLAPDGAVSEGVTG